MRSVYLRVTAGTLVAACLAIPLGAQPAPPDESLAPPVETLVARALERAPSLAALRARLAASEASVPAAGALPNPMVEFEYRAGGFPRYTIGSDPGSMLGAMVRQDLLSKGRREARRASAAAGVNLGRAELDARRVELATAVRERYSRLYAIDREAETLDDAAQLLRLLEAPPSARYAAGEADQASVLRAQLEQSRLGERRADLAADRLAVAAELNRLLDDSPDTAIGHVRTLPSGSERAFAHPRSDTAAAAGEQAPQLAVTRAEEALAGTRVTEARQELRRAWSVGGGLYWMGGIDRAAVFNVGIELPFRKDRLQRPLIAAAERELEAAQAAVADVTAEVRAEIRRLEVVQRNASAQIGRYQGAIMPQSSAALDATRSSYLAGRGDFVAVLDEFRRWVEVRVDLARRETDRYLALVQLAALTGDATPAGTGGKGQGAGDR